MSRRKDVKLATVKSNSKVNGVGKKYKETKFKIRASKNLYTLVLSDDDKASKLQQSLPPDLKIVTIA